MNVRIVLLEIGIVVIANRALLAVIGKAPPISVAMWCAFAALIVAAIAAIAVYEYLKSRERIAFGRSKVTLATIRPYEPGAALVHAGGAARHDIYLN